MLRTIMAACGLVAGVALMGLALLIGWDAAVIEADPSMSFGGTLVAFIMFIFGVLLGASSADAIWPGTFNGQIHVELSACRPRRRQFRHYRRRR